MRKFLIGSAAVAVSLAMLACTPAAKEEEAAAPDVTAEKAAPAPDAAAAPESATEGAAKEGEASAGGTAAPSAAADEPASGEHGGSIKVGDGN